MPYNDENRHGRWYIPAGNPDHVDAAAWYPPEPSAPPAGEAAPDPGRTDPERGPSAGPGEPAAPTAGKPRRRTLRILGLVLGGLVVLTALLFVLARTFQFQTQISTGGKDSAVRPYTYSQQPESSEIPDSVLEYFDSYFSGSDAISIAQAPTGTGVTLSLVKDLGPELSLQEIYQKVSPCVVGVVAYYEGNLWSQGTGVVFTADGYIITNAHVLEGADAAIIRLTDGSEYDALLLGSDTATDLAVLKIDGQDLPYALFADSADCQVGDSVAAIGNPLGENYAGTFTNGIISGIDRHVSNNGYSMSLLQTNTALNEGNSGGPLINMHGQVIGITNMKIMYSSYSTVEGIGFAIPSSVVKAAVDEIIAHGAVLGQPALGITAGSVSTEAMSLYGLPKGVYVSTVHENSDAWAQGLREGDVITSVNGVAVTTVAQVNALKEGLSVGDTILLEVYREGENFEMEFALVDSSQVQ